MAKHRKRAITRHRDREMEEEGRERERESDREALTRGTREWDEESRKKQQNQQMR